MWVTEWKWGRICGKDEHWCGRRRNGRQKMSLRRQKSSTYSAASVVDRISAGGELRQTGGWWRYKLTCNQGCRAYCRVFVKRKKSVNRGGVWNYDISLSRSVLSVCGRSAAWSHSDKYDNVVWLLCRACEWTELLEWMKMMSFSVQRWKLAGCLFAVFYFLSLWPEKKAVKPLGLVDYSLSF